MKRQETLLRMATLLLLLSCTAVFIIGTLGEIRRSQSSAPAGQEGVLGYSRQEHFKSTTGSPRADFTRMNIHLEFPTVTKGHHMRWVPSFGKENYNETDGAIVIPQKGRYYVYVNIALKWMCEEEAEIDNGTEAEKSTCTNSKPLNIQLHEWKDSYPKDNDIMQAWDSIPANSNGMRNVYLGRIFDLTAGSRLKVLIGMGSELVNTDKTSFGCFLL